MALTKAWQGPYVIQDDARSHVVWMLRFINPDLFPADWIINYFQSVAPWGYKTLYQVLAAIGIHPFTANYLLPTALGLITTGYAFGVCWQIFPVPVAGFLTTLLLNQNLWLKDDLITATPRAFFYPLFLGFLYYFLRQSRSGMIGTIIVLSAFYPQGVLLVLGILTLHLIRLLVTQQLTISASNRFTVLISLGVGILTLLPHLLNTSEFGPVITLSEARNLPEFYPGGRAAFFTDQPWDFWITGDRSGLLPQEWFRKSIPPQVFAGFLLPVLLKFPQRFPLVQKVNRNAILLPEILLASTGLFLLAHAFLFRLHHPSRYSQHSLRIVAAIAGGIVITILLDFFRQRFIIQTLWPKVGLFALLFVLLCYPSLFNRFPTTNYVVGRYSALYEFLANTPLDTRIASIASQVNNLPAFTQRSILVGSEYALPYHQGYYAEIQQRAEALAQAQYSSDLAEMKSLIQQYGINLWLIESNFSEPDYIDQNSFFQIVNPQITQQIKENLNKENQPVLTRFMGDRTVFKVDNFQVLDTTCLLRSQK
ncbi:MAG: hypothetical protein ACFBSC_17445 [Microcoleaceae cyanobacterium]